MGKMRGNTQKSTCSCAVADALGYDDSGDRRLAYGVSSAAPVAVVCYEDDARV